MSPEQAQGKVNEIDHRSDIFSFGCIFYEVITHHKPFEGNDPIESLNKIIREQPPSITSFNSDVPYDLQRVVRRCLAKDPEERYQTIKDVSIELKDVRRELQAGTGIDTTLPPSPTTVPSGQAISSSDSSRVSAASPSLSPQATSMHPSSAEYIITGIKQHRVAAGIVGGVLALVIATIGIGLYKFIGGKKSASPPTPKLQRLTSSGKASDAAISPDGKYVAHVKSDAGQQSLWLRQVVTTSDTQIVTPSTQNYYGITFSKDGDYIYYALGELNNLARTLYLVPVLGGAPRKVIENVSSPVSFSKDGTRLAFIRANLLRGETALVVANADGTGERPVAVRKQFANIDSYCTGGPSWSPDGKLIAVGVLGFYGSDSQAGVTLVEVQVETGAERPITSYKWHPTPTVQVAWLADGSGLALTGLDPETFFFQIWYISYPGGEVRKITNELNNYNRLSLTADSSALVTVQTGGTASVWVVPQGEASRARQISSGRNDGQLGLSWMPGGKIVYTSREGGTWDIWSMDADGKNQKQLTAHASANFSPWATADGRYIVFSSTRTRGARTIWRMDPDGGNLKQLTEGPGDFIARSSPDSRWVVFPSARAGSTRLWKVSIDGGEPLRLTDKFIFTAPPIVSPDGSLIACLYREDQPNAARKVAIIPFAGGDPVKVLDLPRPSFSALGGFWTLDGRALTYVDTINGVSNIWSLPLDGGPPKQLTDFKTDQIFWFDFSRDGKQLALSRGTQTSDVILIRYFK